MNAARPAVQLCLSVPARKHRAFLADTIDVWRPITHVAAVVDAGVIPADVIAPDHENVGLLRFREDGSWQDENACEQGNYNQDWF